MAYTAAVITISDKGAAGLREDTSGPAICEKLEERGWSVAHRSTVPDEPLQIRTELVRCADELCVNLVLTSGGTGFSKRDVTPEATLEVVERRTPGIPEAMRAESMRITPRGMLSRQEAGIRGDTLIVNLPGSKKAALECLNAIADSVQHGVDMLLGTAAECASRGRVISVCGGEKSRAVERGEQVSLVGQDSVFQGADTAVAIGDLLLGDLPRGARLRLGSAVVQVRAASESAVIAEVSEGGDITAGDGAIVLGIDFTAL